MNSPDAANSRPSHDRALELLKAHGVTPNPEGTVVEKALCPIRVTVGPAGLFRGNDHFVIQAAIDYVARLGGGTVELLEGEYFLRRPLDLPSHLSLTGQGESTVLRKEPTAAIPVVSDKDWYQASVTLARTDGLVQGDSVLLCSQRLDGGEALQYTRHTIADISGQEVFFSSCLEVANHWVKNSARLLPIHSLIEARNQHNIVLRDFVLRGCGDEMPWLDGNVGGAIFLNESRDVEISGISIQDFNGDGISWQACPDVTVQDCRFTGIHSNGIHPGSGSLRPVIVRNALQDCGVGVYSCWGIQHAWIANNVIENSRQHGISVGHRSSLNVLEKNQVSGCREAGIFFRPERKPEYTARQILVLENSIRCPESSGVCSGISIPRGSQNIFLIANAIFRSGNPEATALDVDENAGEIHRKDNQIHD